MKCITKADGTTTDDSEDLEIAILIYNLIENSSCHSKTTGRLWFYSKDEATDFNNNIANTDDFKSFKYKVKLLGNTAAQPAPNNVNGILRKCNNCCAIKKPKQFLEITQNAIS